MVKKLLFDYEMSLDFGAPVTDHFFQLRCVPQTDASQQIYGLDIAVDPDVAYNEGTDSFGNTVFVGRIPEPHRTFACSVRGIAFVDASHRVHMPYKPLYRFPSRYCVPGPHVESVAEASRAEGGRQRTPLEIAQAVMDEVFSRLTYSPGATTVRTTGEEALALGAGVCQDYAQAMIAACRLLGVPTRYVAGLLVGEGATHAWVDVYQSGTWWGFDPTHDRRVGDDYITIAHGRDCGDCALDTGVFKGAIAHQVQRVHASVREQSPSETEPEAPSSSPTPAALLQDEHSEAPVPRTRPDHAA